MIDWCGFETGLDIQSKLRGNQPSSAPMPLKTPPKLSRSSSSTSTFSRLGRSATTRLSSVLLPPPFRGQPISNISLVSPRVFGDVRWFSLGFGFKFEDFAGFPRLLVDFRWFSSVSGIKVRRSRWVSSGSG